MLKTVGSTVKTVSSTVWNDQMAKLRDMVRPWYLVPTIMGVLMIVVGVATSPRAHVVKKQGVSGVTHVTDVGEPVDTGKGVGWNFAVIVIGFLCILIPTIVLEVKHWRAFLEQFMIHSALKSVVGWS